MERPQFATKQEYGARFTDATYWRPYVEAACARHNLPCTSSVSGLPGTNPVFLVDGRYVVKFFTELFDGAESFAIELDVYRLAAQTDLLVPRLLAHGTLFLGDDGWSWPYLITTIIRGTSLGEARADVTFADEQAIAVFLGSLLRRFHNLPLKAASVLPHSWDGFITFLTAQRHACVTNDPQRGIPEHLVAQLDSYLPPVEALIDRTTIPQLVHADLNEDHLLGISTDAGWQLSGVIDFGDVLVGDWMYELGALHIGLFRCDKRLLRAFLGSYGLDNAAQQEFISRAMSLALLHRFNIIGRVFTDFPQAREVASLDELAILLWDIDQPGLPGSESR